MPYVVELKRVVRCPDCSHDNAYFRIRKGNWCCRTCGCIFGITLKGKVWKQSSLFSQLVPDTEGHDNGLATSDAG